MCEFGDESFCTRVPHRFRFQLLHELWVQNLMWSVFVSSTEDGIGSIVVSHAGPIIMSKYEEVMIEAEMLVRWAHDILEERQGKPLIPVFASPSVKKILNNNVDFCALVDGRVRTIGPFPPLKLFKHYAQAL